jgi:hypothetical protein
MGRTRRNEKTDFDSEFSQSRSKRKQRHARNIPGVGMRTIYNPDEFFDDIAIDEKIAILLNNTRIK